MGFLVDSRNAVSTVLFFLVGFWLSVYLWLCSSFSSLHLSFARLNESLILSILFCVYYVCSFRYILANSFCAFFFFFSFRAFVFVEFFLLHLEAVWTFARFSLTTYVSQRTLDLVLGSVGMYFAATSRCALMKFLYSSFGVNISVFSCSASNLFLNASTYSSLI